MLYDIHIIIQNFIHAKSSLRTLYIAETQDCRLICKCCDLIKESVVLGSSLIASNEFCGVIKRGIYLEKRKIHVGMLLQSQVSGSQLNQGSLLVSGLFKSS